MKTYRAVSNLDSEGRDPALALLRGRTRSNLGGQADVKYFDGIGDATLFLLRAGGGGIIYRDSDDSVAAVIQPGEREFRSVLPDGASDFFASAKAAKDWMVRHGSGWTEQYDPAIARYVTIAKLEVVA